MNDIIAAPTLLPLSPSPPSLASSCDSADLVDVATTSPAAETRAQSIAGPPLGRVEPLPLPGIKGRANAVAPVLAKQWFVHATVFLRRQTDAIAGARLGPTVETRCALIIPLVPVTGSGSHTATKENSTSSPRRPEEEGAAAVMLRMITQQQEGKRKSAAVTCTHPKPKASRSSV